MKKKVLYLLPFLLFVFLFSGCNTENIDLSNSITFSIEILENGQISQQITFPTQLKEIELKEEEEKLYLDTLAKEIKSKLFFPYYFNFYTISSLSQNIDYKIGGDKMSYSLPTYNENDNTISFSFSFADSEVWDFYQLKKDEEKDNTEYVKGFFFTKGISRNNFVFSESMTTNNEITTLGNYFYTILSTTQKEFSNKDISKPTFSYQYSHFSNKLHTNSDFKTKQNGQYINLWQQKFEELGNEKSVEIMLYSPNKAAWYFLALGGTITIVGVSCLVKFLSKRKDEKKETKLNA
jgi:hypothetical protein